MAMPRDNVYRAGWVVSDPWNVIRNGWVRVASQAIVEVGQGRVPADADNVIDCGPGVILPGLVNAHTHLELSALKGATETDRGLVGWVESVIRLRENIDPHRLIESAAEGLHRICASGTVLVGEIASLGVTRELFETAPVSGVWFREYLGTALPAEQESDTGVFESGSDKRFSVAGHAPHTTAPDLLVALKRMADQKGFVFGLHLAESVAEVEFLARGQGEWAEFMTQRGIDTRNWPVPGKRPVQFCDDLKLLDKHTLAVHLLQCDRRDVALIADRGVRVCLCPRSNRILHDRLPDIPAMLAAGIRPCLGTDSLASNETLSLFDEMEFVAREFPAVSPAENLAMATVNGAAALDFENRFGRLAPGAIARFLYLPVFAETTASLLDAIVHRGKDFEPTLTAS